MKIWLMILAIAASAFAQDEAARVGRDQARSMVITKFGIVATSQTLAAQAGARMLEEGGNAIDAAIAANAMLGVVEPAMNGMGGDLFAIVYEAKSTKLYGLNSSGWTPAGLTPEVLAKKGITDINRGGVDRIMVPGAVAGWQALRDKFGTMQLHKLLSAAIYYAENGYPVTEIISQEWIAAEKTQSVDAGIQRNLHARRTLAEAGRDVFRIAALAASLKLVAAKGRDGFYKGLARRKAGEFSA